MIRLLQTGPLATFQDHGRRGRAHEGIARAGAFDRAAHRLANRLVGNVESAATIEVLFGPFEFVTDSAGLFAATGTSANITVTANDGSVRHEATNAVVSMAPGDTVRVDAPVEGLRTYISVRGGFAVDSVLGSRSWDSLGKIGPPPLVSGQQVAIDSVVESEPWFEPVIVRPHTSVIPIGIGPRFDWLAEDGKRALFHSTWTVDGSSNRTGIRLTGNALPRRAGELASEAMIPGAVQLPPNGQPIVLGPDCGVTGGYPVIGVVPQAGIDALAQMRPGTTFRFGVAH